MKDDFKFLISFTCTKCIDCPDFEPATDYPAYCGRADDGDSIYDSLDNNYSKTIHKNCPRRTESV